MKKHNREPQSILDTIHEIIVLSPLWSIALFCGWKEISKFLETL
jgi:hypothetical protein